mgnify:CR=1 FL=1
MGEQMSRRRISESQRRAYLDALGVECWVRREKPAGDSIEPNATLEQGEPDALRRVPTHVADSATPADLNSQSLSAAAPSPAARGTDQFNPAAHGINQPSSAPRETRQQSTQADPSANTANRSTPPARESNSSDAMMPRVMSADETRAWEILRADVAPCVRCELHKQRTQTVFGVGNPQAEWLVIGEAPGADEDRQGEPFVGKAGQLLNAMLFAIGFNRGDVYITNVVKCRPPQNRDPQPQEAAACADYLRRQIALIRPKIILALGRVAAQNLLNTDTPIGKLRQVAHRYADTAIPLVATYHPAYLLRSPLEKRKAWQDLLFAREVLARTKGMD